MVHETVSQGLARWLRATAITLALALGCPITAHADAPSVVIVFDGSGSMWGRIDEGKKLQKLDAAREGVRGALATIPDGARVGLMSFGHRRSGDCADIEVLAPLASGDASRIVTPLDKLNPRGKGPIAGALREAAKLLAGVPQSSIILIHDNADNCRADPCEVATEIAASQPGLRVHLVGLALDPDELARTSCVAKTTGGQIFDARDAPAVATSLAQAVRLALLDPANPVAAPLAVASPPVPQAPPVGAPGLALSARLSADTGILALPVRWRVLPEGGSAPVFEANAPAATASVPAGRYTVEAQIGYVTAKTGATAATAGPTPVALTLNAAALRINARSVKDGAVSPSALVALTPTGAAMPLWIGLSRDADFILPAGSFDIAVSEGLTTQQERVVLAAGAAVAQDVVSGSGQLDVSAVATPDGEPLSSVTFIIATDDPDQPDGRREIARSAARQPVFTLPSGTYYVTARTASGDVRQRVGIGAGDKVKRSIALGLAKVMVAAEIGSGRKDATATQAKPTPWLLRILSLDGDPREVARARASQSEFSLPTGRYRIEASTDGSLIKASQDIEVEGGAPRRVSLKLDGAPVVLRAIQPGNAALPADVAWDVRDGNGTSIARSFDASPRLLLAPGRYTARLDVAGRQLERSLDVTADGQTRIVEFALP